MAHTPANKGLSSILRGINNGLSAFGRHVGPNVEEDSSVEDQSDLNSNLSALFNSFH